MNSYTDEHGRIVAPVEPGPLVQTVDFGSFCDDIRFLAAALGKQPAPPDQLQRWLDSKFKLVSHLPLQRWIEISNVATNSWRFWNEFSASWVTTACAECDRLQKSKENPIPDLPNVQPIGAYIGVWLAQCAEARSLGKPEPTMAEVKAEMLSKGLDPDEARPSQNQLILHSIDGALADKPKPQGLDMAQARQAKREVEHLWA